MTPRAYHYDKTLTAVVYLMKVDASAANTFRETLAADYAKAQQIGDGIRIAALREAIADTTPLVDAPYGKCPHCGLPAIRREPRENGNDHCPNGHVYPTPV